LNEWEVDMRRSWRTGGLAAGILGLAILGCDSGSKSKTQSGAEVEETGEDISKNPLGALKQLTQAGQELKEKTEALKNREPVEPVKFDALIALLPEPEGWKAAEPQGQTVNMAEWKISNAKRSYTKGDGAERSTIKLELIDGSYVPMVYAPFTMMSKFSQESTEGYTKGIKIDGQPAMEEWKKKSKRAKIVVLIEDRFLLTVSGRNITPEIAREWAGLVGVGKVAALAKG
jgi:hypothetical protein